TMADLGAVHTAQERYQDAERVLREGLTIVEEFGQADRKAGSLLYNRLGNLYLRQGRYAEAEPLIRRALMIREQTKEELEIVISLDDLGRLKRAQQSYVEAEPLIRRALEIRERTKPADHPDVADTVENLAEL